MSIRVGEVIAVQGTKVVLKIDEQSSKETLFHGGDKYKGVSIREYLSIQHGFRDIICMVEGEYLDESRVETRDGKATFIRKVEARPIGFFDRSGFTQGIKFLPMIQDAAYLLTEDRIGSIFDRKADSSFKIGQMLKEEIAVGLPWKRLFNSHIGIFGNTGSGKSNTLAKLYTVLFDRKLPRIVGKSRFVILDFNGEYGGEQLAPATHKKVYQLSTQEQPGGANAGDKFPLAPTEFWDLETLSLLFQATMNTQRPFLSRVLTGKARFDDQQGSLDTYAKSKFRQAFCAGEVRPATLDLMRVVARRINYQALDDLLKQVNWHQRAGRFTRNGVFFDAEGENYHHHIAPIVDALDTSRLDDFDQLIVRVNLQLMSDLNAGFVQFEHIQPLLKRVESSLKSMRRVLSVANVAEDEKVLTVISLRRCNNEVKKVLPLLFAKHYYNAHKTTVANPPDRTVHLIVDEAHNILSEQSTRESESWKDYRLELFEEIIKEGRKFGIFVTIASQRPADISPTIVSQLHNFFIHRLVNDRDLFLVDNTISTLDALSRSLIPGLSQGCCVVTGTAFELPMVIQVDRLPTDKQPASEDVDLEKLWSEAPAV
ncbi:ATP-binding protein [Burkholderia pseudomallei]|uniref:ATP-binding protein n=1 Tax=Burkholderia pseudomallei TaxID=28450 RepID=UPI0009784C8D|nr:ATP-binding protein [Burkholderia pseudomallei]OMS60838.1 nucleotidyltransferase [Burkholderia pseudomallei]ONE15024.1 nucleotidyltransferase [Burkholderia pseudomallei]ONE40742.1 nucleotidyltransferase [Burkholderia pseudomallei]ONE41916.1 nucleotidyltransferase [Burkholderia pseudomallei]CAJ4187952.1 Type IV secretory pathway, VirB4 components [Burkholderia pseudomallei]